MAQADLPPLQASAFDSDAPFRLSPELFGSGFKNYRLLLVRRDLAEAFAEASPRDFKVVDVARAGT